jgi:hypothetical protein
MNDLRFEFRLYLCSYELDTLVPYANLLVTVFRNANRFLNPLLTNLQTERLALRNGFITRARIRRIDTDGIVSRLHLVSVICPAMNLIIAPLNLFVTHNT